ncbi:MAG TPA: NAD(P)/FAD-dependent oxidoreductase [bacterium]|nr:NAD(P)/FAD-dependent oxidoreductase [bacterium]
MNEYDVIIVGAGPAGYTCAIRCAQYGMKTAIVEKQHTGGCCLNKGCIPTKALFSIVNKCFDSFPEWTKISFHIKNNVIARLRSGIGMLLKSNGIDYFQATAEIKQPGAVVVEGNILKTKKIVIATGAGVNIPEKFLQDPRILTSDTIWDIEKLPETMAIIGAGSIGCEFASIFSRLGVKITLYEMFNQILPGKDKEIVSILANSFIKKGIQIKTNIKIDSTDEIPQQCILWATGRKPSMSAFDSLDLKLSEDGLYVDEKMETSIPGIFAIGDVTGKWQLAYVATRGRGGCVGLRRTTCFYFL